MPTVEISEVVKAKLDALKDRSGSKTYSDAINLALTENALLHQQLNITKELLLEFKAMRIRNKSEEIFEKFEQKATKE
ncbi:MAG: hypothetical protein ACFE85_11735 [Candidatus Hodarchaeota archaeon]